MFKNNAKNADCFCFKFQPMNVEFLSIKILPHSPMQQRIAAHNIRNAI
jgi:hypothetical protein